MELQVTIWKLAVWPQLVTFIYGEPNLGDDKINQGHFAIYLSGKISASLRNLVAACFKSQEVAKEICLEKHMLKSNFMAYPDLHVQIIALGPQTDTIYLWELPEHLSFASSHRISRYSLIRSLAVGGFGQRAVKIDEVTDRRGRRQPPNPAFRIGSSVHFAVAYFLNFTQLVESILVHPGIEDLSATPILDDIGSHAYRIVQYDPSETVKRLATFINLLKSHPQH